jgi:serine/threonine-protein kinase
MNPEKIGRYEIKSELGRGGMATVYRAWDPRFEREVALKVLPREMMHDGSFRVRFEREAKTIASLEHPAIVPVYDVGEEDDQPYFVMRLMVGGSLADTISKGPISLQEAARIMDRLGPALDVAHAKGIIHRDLKPGNILFDRTGEPYVSDFGIAKIAQSQGSTVTGGAIIGTPAYMSPEQAQGDPLDGRSDIYALGVILYEMLAGAQPYQATTPMAVVVKHITDPIPHILDANPRLPAGIELIIEKAMAKNPDQRFSTAGELAAALNALAHGESAEDALKTAVLSVSNTQAVKTRMAGKADATRRVNAKDAPKPGVSPLAFILPIAGIVVIGIIVIAVVGGYFLATSLAPTPTATTNAPAITNTVVPPSTTNLPTETAELALTPTATQPAQETASSPPPTPDPHGVPAVGGADMMALIANNDVWLMNIDGSNPRQLTNDRGAKQGLQWMPDGETLVYISGKNIYSVNSVTDRVDILMTFPNTGFLDAFRVSPDGKQVAISMNHEMFIVPLDLAKLKDAHGRDALIAMKGCISPTPGTLAATFVRKFRWAADGKLISWLFAGRDSNGTQVDNVDIMDISACDPTKIQRMDEFPGVRFTISKPDISDFDWDGKSLFVFNTVIRNGGWGDLYTYNRDIGKGNQLAPIGGKSKCCYRDARWSPDGTFLFFAFQDRNQGDKATTQLYYQPFGALDTGANFPPILMPEGFFKLNMREAIEFAPHPAKP